MCPHCKSKQEPTIYCKGEEPCYDVCVECGKRFDDDKVNNTLPLKEYE